MPLPLAHGRHYLSVAVRIQLETCRMTDDRCFVGEFSLIFQNTSQLIFDPLRQALIVIVEECDKFPSGFGQDPVPRGRDPMVALVTNQPYLRLLTAQPRQYLYRGVRGTIIHDEDFDRMPGLRQRRSHRSLYCRCRIKGGDTDGDELCHSNLASGAPDQVCPAVKLRFGCVTGHSFDGIRTPPNALRSVSHRSIQHLCEAVCVIFTVGEPSALAISDQLSHPGGAAKTHSRQPMGQRFGKRIRKALPPRGNGKEVSHGVSLRDIPRRLFYQHSPGDAAVDGKTPERRLLWSVANDQKIPGWMIVGNQRVGLYERVETFLHAIEPAHRKQCEPAIWTRLRRPPAPSGHRYGVGYDLDPV